MWNKVKLNLDDGLSREALQESNLLEELNHLLFLFFLKTLDVCNVVILVDCGEVSRPGRID